jgi:hypothetical protein
MVLDAWLLAISIDRDTCKEVGREQVPVVRIAEGAQEDVGPNPVVS